jgi:hypothetical protein
VQCLNLPWQPEHSLVVVVVVLVVVVVMLCWQPQGLLLLSQHPWLVSMSA